MQNGTLIKNRYKIVQPNAIGRGSFSRVYLGVDMETQEQVAIKTIDVGTIPSKYIDKLNEEIAIVKSLEHPNIVKTLDVEYQIDNLYMYIVMEYCSGGDFEKFLSKPPVGWETRQREKEVCNYMYQLMQGLKYLRSKKILHRDLKPANLLLTHDKILKISDFGFAKDLPDNVLTETLCGSPLYMAPEIFLERQYSSKSDLWSVGVILYQALYGKPVYNVTNQFELIKCLRDSPIVFPKNVHLSTECLDFLNGLLQKDPHIRISWPEFFQHPWWRLVNKQEFTLPIHTHFEFPKTSNSDDFFNSENTTQYKLSDFSNHTVERKPIQEHTLYGSSGRTSGPVARSSPITIKNSQANNISFSYSPQLIEDYTPPARDLIRSGPEYYSEISRNSEKEACTPEKESTLSILWHAISSSFRFFSGVSGGSSGMDLR